MDHLPDSRIVLLGLSEHAETRADGAFRQPTARNNSPRTPQDRPGHGTTDGTTPAPHWLDGAAVLTAESGFACGFHRGAVWSILRTPDGWRAVARGPGGDTRVAHTNRTVALDGLARVRGWWPVRREVAHG